MKGPRWKVLWLSGESSPHCLGMFVTIEPAQSVALGAVPGRPNGAAASLHEQAESTSYLVCGRGL